MTVFHHTIDSGGAGGVPKVLGQNVYLHRIFLHTSTNFPNSRNAFREAAHVIPVQRAGETSRLPPGVQDKKNTGFTIENDSLKKSKLYTISI